MRLKDSRSLWDICGLYIYIDIYIYDLFVYLRMYSYI